MKIVHTPSEIKKHKKGLCSTAYCMKPHMEGRYKCHSCRVNVVRHNNPLKYAYHVLRNNAKRRNKPFMLSFEYFKTLAEKNNYMNKKGTKSKSLQIDRCNEEEGYHDWNVQCITLAENVHKYKTHKSSLKLKAETPF